MGVQGVTKPGEVRKVAGEGMPIYESIKKGDLYVSFTIDFPTSLTAEQKTTVSAIFG